MYSCDLEDTDSTRSTAAGKGLLPPSDETSASAGTRMSAGPTEHKPTGLPFWPTASHRKTSSHQVCGGLSHSSRKQIRVCRVEAEEPAAWLRAVTVGNGVKQRDWNELGGEITGCVRDENEVEGRQQSLQDSWPERRTCRACGRMRCAAGGVSGVCVNVCSRLGPGQGAACKGSCPHAMEAGGRESGGAPRSDPGGRDSECLQELLREVRRVSRKLGRREASGWGEGSGVQAAHHMGPQGP